MADRPSAGTALAFYALIGFEDSVNVAEETKDPARDYPRALFGGLLIAGAIYLVIGDPRSAVLSDDQQIDGGRRRRCSRSSQLGPLSIDAKIFAVIALFALANGALINMIMASRLIYGMARQRIVPRFFGRVHRERHTPLGGDRLHDRAGRDPDGDRGHLERARGRRP